MRIIGGDLSGRRINPPRFFTDRPTTDMAKEALFNMLASRYDFENLNALDLFAGSGSISMELASRGCTRVTTVDQNSRYLSFIKQCLSDFNLTGVTLIKADVFKFIQNNNNTFNFIFADPPYDLKGIEKIPQIIIEKKILEPGGMLVVEHSKYTNLSIEKGFTETRVYGHVNFSFFRSE